MRLVRSLIYVLAALAGLYLLAAVLYTIPMVIFIGMVVRIINGYLVPFIKQPNSKVLCHLFEAPVIIRDAS